MHQPDFVPVPPRRAPTSRPFRSRLLRLTGLCFLLLLMGLTARDLGRFAVAEAADVTVFGPRTYARDTGKPKLVVDNFTIANPAGAFTLVIENGADKKSRVASAVVLINGVVLVGPEAFDKQVERIQRPVWLRTQNQISVEVRGQPKTFLKVSILSGRRNQRPVADAGKDQTVPLGQTVELDGSGSTDGDGHALTFHWSLTKPAGSSATLSSATAIKPTFTVDKAGTYSAELVVNDGRENSVPDTVTISTQNSPPRAEARLDMPEQKVYVGSTVVLNGEASSDADGDPLTYLWSIEFESRSNGALLNNPTSSKPSLTLSKPGSYLMKLVVDDGRASSEPAYLTVTTLNSAPAADAGPDQSGRAGDTITLDGAQSYDVDGDALSYLWALTAQPAGSAITLSCDPASPQCTFAPQAAGAYLAQLIVQETDTPDKLTSPADTVSITITASDGGPNAPPVFTSAPVTTATAGAAYTYPVAAYDPDGDALSFSLVVAPGGMVIDPLSGVLAWVPLASQVGLQQVTVRATDARNASSDQSFHIDVAAAGIAVPDVVGQTQAAAGSAITAAGLVVGNVTQASSDTVPVGQVISQSPPAGASVTAGTAVHLIVSSGPVVPPDVPALPAPPVDPSVATTVAASTSFLYSGPNPVQTGVAPGTIEARRAAVIRGRILDREGQPLPGVSLTVLGHPEFGQTVSRADGMFDMAVNGGGVLTVNYNKPGLLPAQRQIEVPWQDFAIVPDVVLIPLDVQVTAVSANAADMQVHQSSVSTDADGSRKVVLLFPAGTSAQMVMPNGATQPLTTLSVRATEYTVGPNGPRAMPGLLPPASGYTYAAELSVDEAMAAGAAMVAFSQPIPTYVENFLNFPVGGTVPVGYYDKIKGAWVPAPNGRVIKITGVSAGLAEVDTVGSGSLPPIVLTDAERQQLAALFPVNTSLWRVPVSHFTPWDCNWPYAPPEDATAPDQKEPETEESLDEGLCEASGSSVIECQNQILGEAVNVVGTPYSLNYRSDRVPGRTATQTITVQASGASVPASLKRIEVTVNVAGQSYHQVLAAAANQTVTFTWDGRDAYGRPSQGSRTYSGSIGYVYDAVYRHPAAFGEAFARFGGAPISGNRTRGEITISQNIGGRIGALMDARGFGIGGWTLDVHSAYDTTGQVAYHGSGRRHRAQSVSEVISNYAASVIRLPSGLAVAPDGTVYYSEGSTLARVRRITPAGVNQVVAGSGSSGFSGDGGLATAAQLNNPAGIALGPDGSVYIADTNNHRIRRVSPAGIISTVAGNGSATFSGDGVPATQTALNNPSAVAAGPDGTLYIADNGNRRIRSVGLDGIITTIAGTGVSGSGGDGGPASQAQINTVFDVKVGPDGSLYIADQGNHRVRRIVPDGTIRTVAGTGVQGFSGDGGPATSAQLFQPRYIAVAPDNGFYISTEGSGHNRIRYVGPDGIIRTVAGTGVSGSAGDGGPALQAQFAARGGIERGPDGSLYIADQRSFVNTNDGRIRRIAPTMPGFSAGDVAVPSEDGSLFYQFDSLGKHLRTRHGLTGAILREFGYDANGRLIQVTEKTGGTDDVTTIQRDGSGHPIRIIGPYGQETVLTVDANGYLASIQNPANETVRMTYSAGGLLQTFTNPRNKSSQYSYDGLGRLIGASDPLGASQAIGRNELATGHEVTRTTPLGRTHKYRVERLPSGSQTLTNFFPDNSQTQTSLLPDGTQSTLLPDGTVGARQMGADPRFGMRAPVAKSQAITPPGGPATLMASSSETSVFFISDPFNFGSLTETSAINGRTTAATYHQSTKTAITTSPVGRTSTVMIDNLGRLVTSQLAGINPTNFTYDGRGRLASITRGTGASARTLTFTYDAAGLVSSITDPIGRVAQYTYDGAGRVTAKTFPDGRVVNMTYDGAGNLSTLTPPGRPATAFAYTDRGELSEISPPAVTGSGPTTYTFNLDKQLSSVVRPDGRSMAYGYDNAGRRTTRTFLTGGVATGTDSFVYDSAGRLTNIAAASGVNLAYRYKGALLTGIDWTGEVTGSVSFAYDNSMRLASESVNGASTVGFNYDNDDLIIGAGALTITRDSQNGFPTGTALGSVSTAITYTGFGETDSYNATAGGAPVFSSSFARDHLGRMIRKVETIGGTTSTYDYTYGVGGQLFEVRKDSVVTESYSYDDNGNRTSATVGGIATAATYDNQDRLLTYGGTTYSYNGAGELQSKNSGGLVTSYQYDQLGNLLSVTLPNGTVVAYVVDGRGRRVGKKINNVLTKQFLYSDTLRPVAELSGTGTLVNRFVYGGSHVPLYMIQGGVNYRLIIDEIGSVRLVVNASTGAIVQRIDYDSFGKVLLDTNPGFQPFGFAGGLYDPDTGLIRMGARDYDPQIGRWTAKDPIGFDGGDANLYRYAGNDPVNKLDPTGQNVYDVMAFLREAIANGQARMASLTRDIAEELTLGNLDDAIELRRARDRVADQLREYRRELERLRGRDPGGVGRRALRCMFWFGVGADLYSANARAEDSGMSTMEQYHEDRAREGRDFRDWISENIVQPIGGYFSGLVGGAFIR